MAPSNAAKSGVCLFIGAVEFGILLIMAEAVSPEYSVSSNYISDLGKVFPNSATIFNPSIIVLGVLVLASGYYVQRAFRWKPGTVTIVAAGIGQLGIGFFPEGSPYSLHSIFSFVTFLSIGLAAILMAKWQRRPLSYFSVVLGVMTLAALVLYIPQSGVTWGSALGIGPGGLERLIVYPSLFWGTAFSGYLMASEDRP
ncbi:MAG: DUF998 domain-containing protein [Thaumarchaeota archaeon]|nr:DUF998 domain-containing protein [Nitrososphaerota archaeon]